MSIEEFAQLAVSQYCKELTDRLFLYIENDKKLMRKYLELVSDEGLEKVNQNLGLLFKEMFHVENIKVNNNPNSKLIKSYTEHTQPKKSSK